MAIRRTPAADGGAGKPETSAHALVQHWNWAAEKGVMNKNTALSLRAACTQVLGVQDDWENLDIATLDLDRAFTQFQNLKKKDFKPVVLETYRRRLNQAVRLYLEYLKDPGGWKPRRVERRPAPDRANGSDAGKSAVRLDMPQTGLVDYPYPIREGQIARLVLPRDITRTEVRRLTAFMETLTVDFDPAGERPERTS